ncbi:GNAT family N-acetyltransferase [Hyphococcus sp.]|uniref:GNAT family N-acetyltransferase n=1 Tax=Hyphococcus sp. TaxID=2038636 RepID=UPI003CCC0744
MTVIQINRYTLRPMMETDAPVLAGLCNDPAIARNTARIPCPYTLEDARRFVRYIAEAGAAGDEFAFAVCADDRIIACCGVAKDGGAWELGYWVAAAARGRGVATQAAGAVTQFAFETLGAETVTAGYFTDNPASARVLDKLGFRATGETVELYSLGRGCAVETRRMALNAADFVRPEGVRIKTAK